MKSFFVTLLSVFLITYATSTFATPSKLIKHERLLSFEDSAVPSFISSKSGNLSIDKSHYKDGGQSLCWEYQANATLSIKKDLHFEKKDPTGKDTYLSTFSVWVYNSKASNSKIEFTFLKDGKLCTSFPIYINFEGWRTVYVAYERDMEGTPQEGMNEIIIKAPEEAGKLYFDMLFTAVKADQRHHTPDNQQPFVNEGVTNHWQTVYKSSLVMPDESLYNPVLTASEKEEISLMGGRLSELIINQTNVTDKSISMLEDRFKKYGISVNNGIISGLPLFYIYYAGIFERLTPNWSRLYYRDQGQEYRDYFVLMQKIANEYVNAKEEKHRDKLQEMFLLMFDHAKDQGVDYGSCLGNFSHYGYSFRGLFTSYFLMKDVLLRNGRLDNAVRTLQWYSQINETFIPPILNGTDMDSFNTLSMGSICSVLIMEDSPEKAQFLRAFSRWVDTGSKPAPGLNAAFKPDGAAFHHRNNYPAYAIGGLDGVTNMIYILSRTSFAISELGHETVKNALLTMRFYCNKTHFPLSMSGRHPDGKGELVPMHFARMAVSGTPDGKQKLDEEVAAAYLRLTESDETGNQPEYMPKSNKKDHQKMIGHFTKLGIKPEKDPEGNKAIGYGCISIQRRGNWSAVVRGHSRYLWAAEHYLGANLYGRYLAHGSMQILTADGDIYVNPKSSGWIQEGFDWGRIPGTTAIHLPVEQLKANVLNVDTHSGYEEMLYSDESFAGGLSANGGNGLFAMKLHEHDKYNGSHRARKSFHFFDNRIVCLGSNIENTINEHNTETTVFQLAATGDKDKEFWKNYKSDNEFWIDHLGTGYYIPQKKQNTAVFEKNFPQSSRYQDTGKPNSGDWVNLLINHGKAPKGASYEYVVIPQTGIELKNKELVKKSYNIIQMDGNAHIVKDNISNTTSFAFFETPKSLPQSIIHSVDTSCLMMLKETDGIVNLTVCNPDLALYRGVSDELYDKQGKRTERSIYSRPWIGNESKEMPVTITLNGEWSINNNDGYIITHKKANKTILIFKCKDAASINVNLRKIKN